MIATKWLLPFFVLLIAGHGARAEDSARTVQGVALESAAALDPVALNKRIKDAAAAGDGSMASPIPMVHALVGGAEETPRVSVESTSVAADDFSRVTVTIARDGFLDDSVRGDWHEFMLSRAANGGWIVLQARKATRCWRGRVDVYADHRCP